MLPPLPRRSSWAYRFAQSPSRVSLPRKGCRVGLRIVLFEACSAFTRVTACTLALSPMRDTHSEGFSYFVTSIAAPATSGWSVRRVGLSPTGKRRLATAHTRSRTTAVGRRIARLFPHLATFIESFCLDSNLHRLPAHPRLAIWLISSIDKGRRLRRLNTLNTSEIFPLGRAAFISIRPSGSISTATFSPAAHRGAAKAPCAR